MVCLFQELRKEKFIKELLEDNLYILEQEVRLIVALPSLTELDILCSIHFLVELSVLIVNSS